MNPPRIRKGYRKYRCDECKADSFHHWIERNRASRLRCPSCGSARMELVSEKAKDEAVAASTNRVVGLRSSTLPPEYKETEDE